MSTLLVRACVFVLLSLALGACAPAAPPQAPAAPVVVAAAPPEPAPASAEAPIAAAAKPAPDAVAAPAAPVAAPAAPPAAAVLASAEGEIPGVRVEVTELKRGSGDTVSLKFVLINDSDASVGFSSGYLGDRSLNQDYRSVGGVHLVDAEGKKKYLVVRDSGSKCVCSDEVRDVEPGKRTNLWAKFPAPPAETQRVSIVIPHFSPMDDVAISQ